jgi:hypothetical protein
MGTRDFLFFVPDHAGPGTHPATSTMGARVREVVFITHPMKAAYTCTTCNEGTFQKLSSGISCTAYYRYNICVSIMRTTWNTFLINLLGISSLYMFRAVLAHPQEALNKRHLVYCVRVMSVGCTRIETSTCFEHYLFILRRRLTRGTWYIACVLCQVAAPGLKCRLFRASWGWASNARNT